jgi:hypothetical protein
MTKLLWCLALLVATNVLVGPLGLGWLVWRVSPLGLNQTYGADAAALLLVVPTTVLAAWTWQRGRRLAAPLALGVGLATLYYAVAETLGGDYYRYPGNSERFFPLFLALIVLSWLVAAGAWARLDAAPPPLPGWLARGFAVLLLLGAGLIGLAWSLQLIGIAVTGTVGPEFLDSPSAFWTIRIVDLGFIVPLCLMTGLGLWHGRAWARRATFGLAAFMTLQAAAVLLMGIVMLWRHDPTASPALVSGLAPITLGLIVGTLLLLRSYTTPPASPSADQSCGDRQWHPQQ